MKLKNKISGEIKEFVLFDGNELQGGATLESLTEDWEDVPEEPKVYWYMSNRGDLRFIDDEDTEWDNERKQIGNYFSSREKAEKAVEKLKAWKRLEDKGFKFTKQISKFDEEKDRWHFLISADCKEWNGNIEADLDLLFGGE